MIVDFVIFQILYTMFSFKSFVNLFKTFFNSVSIVGRVFKFTLFTA